MKKDLFVLHIEGTELVNFDSWINGVKETAFFSTTSFHIQQVIKRAQRAKLIVKFKDMFANIFAFYNSHTFNYK